MHFSIDRTVHTTAFDKPVVDHWLERKIAQTAAGSTEKDRSDDRPLQRRARYRLSSTKEGRKCFIYRRTQHILCTVIWRQTNGKEPLRLQDRKPADRQDSTYHGLCLTSRGALVGTRNIGYMNILESV